MTEEHKLPSDQIRLCDGTTWTVPPLPGGMSEEAMRCVDLALQVQQRWRAQLDSEAALELDHQEAKETINDKVALAAKLKELTQAKMRGNDSWTTFVLSTGYEWLISLYTYGKPKTERPTVEDLAGLFKWPELGGQVVRANIIVMLGRVPKMPEKGARIDRPDFTPPDVTEPEIVNGGS